MVRQEGLYLYLIDLTSLYGDNRRGIAGRGAATGEKFAEASRIT
jgi:hypothetical protein